MDLDIKIILARWYKKYGSTKKTYSATSWKNKNNQKKKEKYINEEKKISTLSLV